MDIRSEKPETMFTSERNDSFAIFDYVLDGGEVAAQSGVVVEEFPRPVELPIGLDLTARTGPAGSTP